MHEHFDAQRAFNHIAELSSMRRLAGTPGETAAQDYFREVFREIGIEERDEEFSYSDAALKLALPAMCLLIGAIGVMGSLAFLWRTSLVIIPGAAMLVALFFGFKWSSMFERFGLRGSRKSLNLVGEIGAAAASGRVLLSAHYDSKSQLMPVLVRASFFIIGYGLAVLFGIAFIVLGVVFAAGQASLGGKAFFLVSLLSPLMMLGLLFNFTGNRSPGALDDASGIAVILEVARVLAADPMNNLDVTIAAFGCEEIGLCGSISYLLAHEEELRQRPFYMINYDIPFTSAGKLVLNTAFELPPVRTCRRLNKLLSETGKEMGIEVSGIYMPVGAGADHMPWVKHGFEATSLVSAASSIHSSRDTLQKVNREGLRRAGEVSLAVLRRLDQEATSLSKKPPPGPSSPSEGPGSGD